MSGTDDELGCMSGGTSRHGTVLPGKCRLDRVLGIGGMATVYAATHRNGNELPIKVLQADLSLRAEIRNRFLREPLIGVRMKRPGSSWKTDTGEHVQHLRALALSGRWTDAMDITLRPPRHAPPSWKRDQDESHSR
jgi:hypothetical protein